MAGGCRSLASELGADIAAQLCGAGPLQSLLDDPTVTEIIVNGCAPVWVEVEGQPRPTEAHFDDDEQLRSVIDRLVGQSGRRIDEARPTVDARLADGSRLNAVLPPVAVGGSLLTIRRPRRQALTVADLVRSGGVSRQAASFLHAAVLGRANLLITGAAGAGKTTVLGALAEFVPTTERIVSVEDTSELRLGHPNWAPLQCRPDGVESAPEVTLRDLLRNSLRMRPDRIVVGEVRGPEAADMIQAMNTGHAGSLATLHANSSADSVGRLEAMLGLAWPGLAMPVIRRWIGIAIDLIVHCKRDAAGHRSISSIVALDIDDAAHIELTSVFRVEPDAGLVPAGVLPPTLPATHARAWRAVPHSASQYFSDRLMAPLFLLAAAAGIAAHETRFLDLRPVRWIDRHSVRRGGVLATAGVAMTPSAWYMGMLARLLGITALLAALGASPLTSLSFALVVARGSGWVQLRRCRSCRIQRLADAAPGVARQLAGALASGRVTPAGVARIAEAAATTGEREVARLVEATACRLAFGAPLDDAFTSATVAVCSPQQPSQTLQLVAATLGLARRDTGSAAIRLRRLADGLERDAQIRRHARASLTEARYVAVAIPIVAVLAISGLSFADPAVIAALLSGPGILVAGAGLLVSTIGVMAVFRTTEVSV